MIPFQICAGGCDIRMQEHKQGTRNGLMEMGFRLQTQKICCLCKRLFESAKKKLHKSKLNV